MAGEIRIVNRLINRGINNNEAYIRKMVEKMDGIIFGGSDSNDYGNSVQQTSDG
jgi:hypothetical protein